MTSYSRADWCGKFAGGSPCGTGKGPDNSSAGTVGGGGTSNAGADGGCRYGPCTTLLTEGNPHIQGKGLNY